MEQAAAQGEEKAAATIEEQAAAPGEAKAAATIEEQAAARGEEKAAATIQGLGIKNQTLNHKDNHRSYFAYRIF